ncbi:hypothetical protein F4808DRAFT_411013 [Astrocystis sublimbata]|nr:hypothetical protein F4808DRAFT_411013 [Astrocystis sublimbata]
MLSGHAIIALSALARTTQAVFVASNSPCQTNCGNVLDATTPDQIVCKDADYGTTAGKVYQSCVACESRSQYITDDGNRTVSDLQAMLYNMRYTTAQCLYHIDTDQCSTQFACMRLTAALEYGNESSDATSVTPYGYCSLWSDYDLDKCTSCLGEAGKDYMRNFVEILSGACQLQLQPPQIIPLTGDIFSHDIVNVTKPTNTAVSQVHNSVGPLSTGALAGVVIGGIVFLLIIAGCGVVINGKRRRKNYLRRREEQAKNWPGPPAGAGETHETPLSQRPLRGGWDDTPVSGTTEGAYPYPRYFSPYTTQYNSPVSAVDSHGQMAWPVEKAQSIGVALSPDHDDVVSPWSEGKGKERADAGADGFEQQEVVHGGESYGYAPPPPPALSVEAPVLSHPGYGRQRQTPSPPY